MTKKASETPMNRTQDGEAAHAQQLKSKALSGVFIELIFSWGSFVATPHYPTYFVPLIWPGSSRVTKIESQYLRFFAQTFYWVMTESLAKESSCHLDRKCPCYSAERKSPWFQRFFAKWRRKPLVMAALNLTFMQLTAVKYVTWVMTLLTNHRGVITIPPIRTEGHALSHALGHALGLALRTNSGETDWNWI